MRCRTCGYQRLRRLRLQGDGLRDVYGEIGNRSMPGKTGGAVAKVDK